MASYERGCYWKMPLVVLSRVSLAIDADELATYSGAHF